MPGPCCVMTRSHVPPREGDIHIPFNMVWLIPIPNIHSFDGSPFHPVWWVTLREFLTDAEVQQILDTTWTMHIGAISYFERKAEYFLRPTLYKTLRKDLKVRRPEILMQHIGAGGHEDAMWMKLHEYLGRDSLPACFLTNRGDAEVFLELREWRLECMQSEMNELLSESDYRLRD